MELFLERSNRDVLRKENAFCEEERLPQKKITLYCRGVICSKPGGGTSQ